MAALSPNRTSAVPLMNDIPTIDLAGKAIDQTGLDSLLKADGPRRIVGADLSGLVFGEVDLGGWQFDNCNLGHARLVRTRLP